MLGTQIGDKLGRFGVRYRVAKGWHLLPAIQYLARNSGRGPGFVLANADQRRSFLAALARYSVAVGASLVAKKNGSGLFIGRGLCIRKSGQRGKNESEQQGCGGRLHSSDHEGDFLIGAGPPASSIRTWPVHGPGAEGPAGILSSICK